MLLPFWVYLVILGILISGVMVLYTAKQEQDEENEYIEREGEIYMKRIEDERLRRSGQVEEV